MKKVTDLKENEGIVCRNEQEAKQIMQLMHDAGLKWCTGQSYFKVDMYYNEIVYVPFAGTHLIIESAIHKNYTIHEAKDFIMEETESELLAKDVINLFQEKFNIKNKNYELLEFLKEIDTIRKKYVNDNTITLPLVNGVPDVSNCGIEMLVSDDGEDWIKQKVICYGKKKNNFPYLTDVFSYFKHAKPLPKQITKQEAEKLLNNEFEIID